MSMSHTDTCSTMNELASPGAEEPVDIITSNWTVTASSNVTFAVDINGMNSSITVVLQVPY